MQEQEQDEEQEEDTRAHPVDSYPEQRVSAVSWFRGTEAVPMTTVQIGHLNGVSFVVHPVEAILVVIDGQSEWPS